MKGHFRFAVINRTVNVGVKALLRSSRHARLSHRLLLITYTGRKSGKRYTIPVHYVEHEGAVTLGIQWPEQKVWWRNLRAPGAPVRLRLRGVERTGYALAIEDSHGVRVEVTLD